MARTLLANFINTLILVKSLLVPASVSPASWSGPGGPWDRFHVDFAGPNRGKMSLVVIDAYSKFLEVSSVNCCLKTF